MGGLTVEEKEGISAKDYEQKWSGYLRNTHDKLLGLLYSEADEDDRILDVSCGTGMLARLVLERNLPFKEYVLNDISPRMLETARGRLPEDRRISFSSYAAEKLPWRYGVSRIF